MSTRAFVSVGDNVAIGGFIVTGNSPKKILVRALGPSLDIDGELLDPVLELHGPDGFATITNDDWQQASNAGDIPADLQPKDPRESTILVTLDPGDYTAIVRGKSNSTGIALVEIYDAATDNPSQLANLSTRALVKTENDVMIGGFIIGGGGGNSNVIVRALGPSLADDGIANVLADPFLDIRNKDGTRLTSNDNWKDDPNADKVSQNGVAPSKDLESALYLSLPPGEYTAIVSGANGENGVGLVEIYHLQAMAAGARGK